MPSTFLSLLKNIYQLPNTYVINEKDGFSITVNDLKTLKGSSWLNDEVINFYMSLIVERFRGYRFFNTFFYPTLIKRGHAGVSKWTKTVDIFSFDTIFVPIHSGAHWCLAMIDFKNHALNYFDSLRGRNDKCLEALLKYLQDEHSLKGKQDDFGTWTLIHAADVLYLFF